MSKDHSTPTSKVNFTLKAEKTTYDFTIINKEEELTFKVEYLKEFPIKLYELNIQFEKLKELDENFLMFKNAEKFIKKIKTFIQSENYSIVFDEEENVIIFEIKNDIFENGAARIKIPEHERDLNVQVESLTKIVSELRKEILTLRIKEKDKDEAAINSFQGSSFLKDEEKKIISKWIHPNKIIRFNMLFSTDKDGDRSTQFHYYCDGIFPTVTVVLDTTGRRFGGYTLHNWCPSAVGGSYSRAPESFIFSLTNNQKFELNDQFHKNAIYRHTSYGPTFGSGHDLYIADQCKSNTSSYCNKSAYKTENNNLLGGNGNTSFQVTTYEVYQVIFE